MSENRFSKFTILELRAIHGMNIIRPAEIGDIAMLWLEQDIRSDNVAAMAFEVPENMFERDELWLSILNELQPNQCLTNRQRLWIFIRACLRMIAEEEWDPFEACDLLFGYVYEFNCVALFDAPDTFMDEKRASYASGEEPTIFAMEEWRLSELYGAFHSVDNFYPISKEAEHRLTIRLAIVEQSKIDLKRWFSEEAKLDVELNAVKGLN